MKRSEFLKKLGLGIGVAVVAPQVFAENEYCEGLIPFMERTKDDARILSDYTMPDFPDLYIPEAEGIGINDVIICQNTEYIVELYNEKTRTWIAKPCKVLIS